MSHLTKGLWVVLLCLGLQLVARRCFVLFDWKHTLLPSHDPRIKEMTYNIKLETLRFSVRGSIKNLSQTMHTVCIFYSRSRHQAWCDKWQSVLNCMILLSLISFTFIYLSNFLLDLFDFFCLFPSLSVLFVSWALYFFVIFFVNVQLSMLMLNKNAL